MTNDNGRRRLILGGGAAIGTIIFFAVIVIVQYIFLQHPKRWDLTKIGKYTLAPQSKKIVEGFKEKNQPIQALAFYTAKEAEDRESARDLLDQYRDVYSNFQYSMIDPDKERSIAVQNKVDAYPSLVLKAGEKSERISTVTEENVTNALAKLSRSDVKKVYFLKGHGELGPDSTGDDGFSVAKTQIEKQNYKTEELLLLQKTAVPEDATMLIIAGPKTDPLDPELESIANYLKRGGNMFVLLSPFKTPKLAEFLKPYGFDTKEDIIIDTMSRVFGGDYLIPVIATYIKFPITKDFTLASFFPESRSVTASEQPGPDVTVQNLALTGPASWTINQAQLDSGKADFDEKAGVKGPISVMAVSTTVFPEKKAVDTAESSPAMDGPDKENTAGSAKKARIAVTGSSLFAANKSLNAIQANRDLFLNSVSWLAEDENLISIRPKSHKAQPLILTGSEPMVIFIVPVIIMPLAWIVAGIVVYLYRKRTVAA